MLRYLVAFVSLSFATGLAAEPLPLSDTAIKETVAGAVVEVDTPVGVRLPIRYGEDGRMTGDARELAYILGAKTDSGKWWVASGRLCHKWGKWFDGEPQCLRIRQDGSRIFWRRDDGETGTAMITTPARVAAKAPKPQGPSSGDAAPKPDAPAATVVASAALPQVGPQEPARVDAQPVLGSMVFAPVLKSEPVLVRRVEEKAPPSEPSAEPPAGARLIASAPEKNSAVMAEKISALQAKRLAPTASAQYFRVSGVAFDDVLNVRSGPSADHVATGAIQPDAVGVKIVGQCVAEWCPIYHRGIKGWVNSLYLATKD